MNPAIPALLAVTSLLASCALEQTATSRAPTKFLASTGSDVSKRDPRLPFEHSWRDPKVDMTKYKYMVVRPITTAYLDGGKWEESKSAVLTNKRAYLRRCDALARYWSKSLNKSFSSPLCIFYKTSDSSQPGTLILEVALTEVRFDRPPPTGSDTPVSADGVVSAVTGPPTCAFESRTRDAATGKLISTASDRRGPEIKVISGARKGFAQPNEAICDEWSQQLMQRSNREIYPTVGRSWLSIF